MKVLYKPTIKPLVNNIHVVGALHANKFVFRCCFSCLTNQLTETLKTVCSVAKKYIWKVEYGSIKDLQSLFINTLPKKSSVNFHSTFIFKAEIQTKNKTTDVKDYQL